MKSKNLDAEKSARNVTPTKDDARSRPKTENVNAAKAPRRTRYKLEDLLREMPDGLPRVPGWDDL